jgi:hypothetical protein
MENQCNNCNCILVYTLFICKVLYFNCGLGYTASLKSLEKMRTNAADAMQVMQLQLIMDARKTLNLQLQQFIAI